MASGEGEIADLYPPPPPYYQFFTEENIERVNEYIKKHERRRVPKNSNNIDVMKEESGKPEGGDIIPVGELDEYPEDMLQFLLPPKKPEGPTYRIFGNIWQFEDKMLSLKEMGVEQLYSNDVADRENSEVKKDQLEVGEKNEEHVEIQEGTLNKETDQQGGLIQKDESNKEVDQKAEPFQENELIKEDQNSSLKRINELKKLFRSLLLNFLELVGIISKNPTLYPAKLEQIRIILINIHHLLNEYRPHQARESLILMLNNQLSYKRNEIKQIRERCEEVKKKLPQVVQRNVQENGFNGKDTPEFGAKKFTEGITETATNQVTDGGTEEKDLDVRKSKHKLTAKETAIIDILKGLDI